MVIIWEITIFCGGNSQSHFKAVRKSTSFKHPPVSSGQAVPAWNQCFIADCGPASGGAIARDAAVRPLSCRFGLAGIWVFSKDSTGNTNVEWSMLKWIIIMETIFNFEAFRLRKFYSCPIWKEKKKKPCKLISAWAEICEARTQNSKGFVSSFFCCYCSIWVCWWVIWSWTHTAPARE